MSQVKALADQVISAVKSYVAESIAKTAERLTELEAKLSSITLEKGERGDKGDKGDKGDAGEPGTPGEKGQDGKDAIGQPGPPGKNAYDCAVSLGFEGTVHDWMESLRGAPGVDGKSVTADDVLPELKVELQKAVAAIPLPKDGKNGEDGKDGKDAQSVTAEDFRTLFEAELAKALLDFERRAQDVLQRAIDRIPPPKDGINGKDGLDGLGFDDFIPEYDGERTFTFKWVRGEQSKVLQFKAPWPIYRGVYQVGQVYDKGDSVSCGGSVWMAQVETTSKPETDDTWKLAVKRGRDGKDGEEGKRGLPGPPGKNGRDLTQLGQDGTKW